jgi:hypothetical protein
MKLYSKSLPLAFIVGLVAATPAHAFVHQRIEAKIPFRFTVEDQTFAPGEYVIEPLNPSNPALLEFKKADGSARRILMTTSTTCDRTLGSAQLVFARRGRERVLRAVYEDGTATGAELQVVPLVPKRVARATIAKKPAATVKRAAVTKPVMPCGTEPATTTAKTQQKKQATQTASR